MLRTIKLATLRFLRGLGAFELVANSRWRRERLLILCYHGTALDDEHLWRPVLYMPPEMLEQRLELLKKRGYSVIGLSAGLEQLRSGSLPPRSVAITFDDGTYDFYKQAYPLLRSYGFPVTVYQTTYYADHEHPVFNLICSYMLWKRRGTVLAEERTLGLNDPLDLRTEPSRHRVVRALIEFAERENMTGCQKDELAATLASALEINYQQLREKRILQLMNASEVKEVANNGVDVQLHTHRHCTPKDEASFRREIQDNRARIRKWTGIEATHFCYPGGVYRPPFLRWLEEEQVASATTCDAGLATQKHKLLLLPRFVDSQHYTQIEFESWVSGIGDRLAVRRVAMQNYVPLDN